MSFVPHTPADRQVMLDAIGVRSVVDLFDVIPEPVRFPTLDLPCQLSEAEAHQELSSLATRNLDASRASWFLGAGIYNHYIPAAVLQIISRGEFYTAYTPYQPEVAQGTLQAIYEYQTMVAELTGMDISNASMYDGATALAEGALLPVSIPKKRTKIIVSGTVHPNYRLVLRTYIRGVAGAVDELSIPVDTLVTTPAMFDEHLDEQTAAVVVQYPNYFGRIEDIAAIAERAHRVGAKLVVSTYPIALGLMKSPGELGADVVTAEGQSLGNAQSFGGPVVGLVAAKKEFVRQMPGRLTGMTEDTEGKRGFVLALQTREQHIRREKATSNICTNQGLNALAACVYMALLGPDGLRQVAALCYHKAHYLAGRIADLPGWRILSDGRFFNEFVARAPVDPGEINRQLQAKSIIGGYALKHVDERLSDFLLVCATELNTRESIDRFVEQLAHFAQPAP
jgi:glycine dehydrogenase subunit 1